MSSSSSTTTDKKLLEKQLRSACEYDEKEKASNLISEQGVDVNTFDERTPLINAAQWGNLAIVQMLIEEYQANINHQSKIGTALHWASYNGHFEVVKYLLSKGADKNIKNNAGQTPEEMARDRGVKVHVCDYLRDFE
ncbi:hypothetical protein NAEGRDRAFT_64631 [Naegleria gruberi]|uniref:Uncharacterized protein n=1 Tax=Naegleria gruberi TaxID=5762 RepID=D2V711_NAEGR|nr:uncharacterized protein NAEGRDRAFT_64631 [Naegleria gruberi]EFC47177.1 hypothetical protein NAEGRDRAFT_64631 [Naegleria gruberi]|eukprot:XP_002679921.1 hypothetical protein NAEGRDRAFT_64631 [Naegleria gruberi strain NEG-M]